MMPDGIKFGEQYFPIIAGPCVIESEEHTLMMAHKLAEIGESMGLDLIFKASFDKANRSSLDAYRGVSIDEAVSIFRRVKEDTGLTVLTDIHTPDQPEALQEVVDVFQIPAFLCRQTDLLVAAALTKKAVVVKKGQFLSPWEVTNILAKLAGSGCKNMAIIERGASYGYNNLVSDMRAIPIMKELGASVIFDATHSAQLPGGGGDYTDGMRDYIPTVARAAVAAGCDGLFIEVHNKPEEALSDKMTQWPLDKFVPLMNQLLAFRKTYMELA